MNKRLKRRKIIILAVAILFATMTFLTAFAGLTLLKNSSSKGAEFEKRTFSLGGATYTYYYNYLKYYEDANGEVLAMSYGRTNDNYYIYTELGLRLLSSFTQERKVTNTCQLMKNVYFTTSGYCGIGSKNYPFAGTFKGNGYTISNLPAKPTAYGDSSIYGLFPVVSSATIKNLNINNTNYNVGHNSTIVGIMVGRSDGELTIENCMVEGTIHINWANAYLSMGGMVAIANSTTSIKNCAIKVNFSTTNYGLGTAAYQAIGGILGIVGDYTTIQNSYFYGSMIFNHHADNEYIGGIVGDTYKIGKGVKRCTITNNIIHITEFKLNYKSYLSASCYNILTYRTSESSQNRYCIEKVTGSLTLNTNNVSPISADWYK